jgi:hypothetical protein
MMPCARIGRASPDGVVGRDHGVEVRHWPLLASVAWFAIVGFVVLVAAPARAQTRQSFDGLTCQSAIPRALIGRTMPIERVVVLERRYRHLSLEHRGAFGVESDGDPWTLVSWRLCGREHLILQRNNVVRDVLVAPAGAGHSESLLVSCPGDGAEAIQLAIVFSPVDGGRASRTAPGVWLIDDQAVRFHQRSTAGIPCRALGSGWR